MPHLPSRRAFLASAVVATGGLALGFRLRKHGLTWFDDPNARHELFNWVTLAPDNSTTLTIAQMELGQGAITAMSQLLAEELDLDWSTIRTEFVSLKRHVAEGNLYGRVATYASLGVKLAEGPLRTAGAQIRSMLVHTAALRLNVPETSLTTKQSHVIHEPSGRQFRYGELAAEAARMTPPTGDRVRLKTPSEWSLIGKSLPRLDTPSKSNGTAVYGIDVDIPGMKHAAIVMSPAFGGRLVSFDATQALTRPGVIRVVRLERERLEDNDTTQDAVAVVADTWWQAQAALTAIPIHWDAGLGGGANSESIAVGLTSGLTGEADRTLRDQGEALAAISAASRVLQADYSFPFLEHATLEPMNCTALVTDRSFEIWAPTQTPDDCMVHAARVSGLPVSSGELHPTLMGGGFGRRQFTDYVVQAVQIAKQLPGVPVKLLWSREETTRHGFYRPATQTRVRVALDEGRVSAWHHRVSSPSDWGSLSTDGADSILYAIPHVRVDLSVRPSPVPLGPFRGVAFSPNCFTTQCFIHEVARSLGEDVYQLQRRLLDPAAVSADVPKGHLLDDISPSDRAERLRRVMDEAVRLAGWQRPLGPRRGRGLAINEEANSAFAVIAFVALDDDDGVAIERVVVVGDPGFVVNPAMATAQVEGSVAFGLSALFFGAITLRDGSVVEGNFDSYRLLRMPDMPKVEVAWLPSGRYWGGVGEPVVSAISPAVANAIVDAGGPRVRSLPFNTLRLSRADAAPDVSST